MPQLVKLNPDAVYLLQSGVGVKEGVWVIVGVRVFVAVGILTETPL